MNRRYESGAVSLFIVIFAMLLITVVTLSFLRLMVSDQQQSSISDLSQSAQDSALAGVEDAKRALIYYRTVCTNNVSTDCDAARSTIESADCNTGLRDVVPSATNGLPVEVQQTQSSSGDSFQQYYTCVKMALVTPDYVGRLDADSSKVIPLKAATATTPHVAVPFTQVQIEWFMANDLGASGTGVNLQSSSPVPDPGGTGVSVWPLLATWPANRPSIMRVQLMQFGSSFTLSEFDGTSSGTSNANTLFLYPTGTSNVAGPTGDTWNFAGHDSRLTAVGAPKGTRCTGTLGGGGYACTAILNLPLPRGETTATNRNAFLRVTSLYKASHFRVTIVGASFDGVQPSIDATGRANTQYRRVESRVDLMDATFPFPDAALDLRGNLCKNFMVTNTINTIPVTQNATCS